MQEQRDNQINEQAENNSSAPAEDKKSRKRGEKKSRTTRGERIGLLITVLVVTFFLGGRIGIGLYNHFMPSTSDKLDMINSLVKSYYSGEIDYDTLEDALATAYMDAIGDKYSFYKNAEDSELVEQSLEGTASGIGITVFGDTELKALGVMRVDADSPADKAGIQKGDRIIAIDGRSVEEMGYSESVKAIKRELGESADITILREDKTIELSVLYEDFVKQSVFWEVVDNYGYVTITDFNNNTVPQFKKAYKALNEQKVKGLIFDVRDNGGGTVDSTCEILDMLVGECDLITVVYSDGSKEVSSEAKSDAEKCDLPMVVLTNENTASAAELFSANLRAMAKAPLIGNNTYGKGVIQRTYFLDDGSCIRFTVGEFLPAGGKGFDGEGLAPDIEVNYTEEQAKNPYLLGKDDPYLKRAIEALNKMIAEEK